MMHYRSHQSRWAYIPLATPRPTRWKRFLAIVNDLVHPSPAPEGRRAIDPTMPFGNWALGWTATYPEKKKSR